MTVGSNAPKLLWVLLCYYISLDFVSSFLSTYTHYTIGTMCPPGVDQTTRTSQQWTLLAPAFEERYSITSDLCDGGYSPDISRFLKISFGWDAFAKLAQYDRDGDRAVSILSALPNRRQARHSSLLEGLPAEIVSMIVSHPDLDPVDVISLGLSCRQLWSHIVHHVVRECRTGPWTDTPIVCTGTWTMSLPNAIYTLYPDIKQAEESFFNCSNDRFRGRGTCPARRYNWNAISRYGKRNEMYNGSVWTQSLTDVGDTAHISAKSLKILRRSLDVIIQPGRSSMPTSWTLRNFTKREYIYMKFDPASGKGEYDVHVKGAPHLSLDKALLLRICWSAPNASEPKDDEDDEDDSEDTRASTRLLNKMKRGKWAGHCFDVVPSDKMFLHVDQPDQWRNVTDKLIKEAAAWSKVFT